MPRDFKSFAKEHRNVMDENKEKTEKYQEIPIIDEYLLCCKQNECINSAVIKFLKERE